jgi:tRNA nucleotidyltransferase (CCA-adding enzyme)
MISIPQSLNPVLEAVSKIGHPRFVGGCVRDALLGVPCSDLDIEVSECSFDELAHTLRRFGSTDVVGRSFGTIKLKLDGTPYDFSLPRRESKTGQGHRGFKIDPDPSLSFAEAAARRDFTVNAMAWDHTDQLLVDPFGGKTDLDQRILRHTSPAFVEDPLRVLRAMQLAARFELELAPETVELCRSISDSFAELPLERVWGEWDKWALLAKKPSAGMRVLRQTNWLRHFPEIAALVDTPQDPGWHPEGDAFEHTLHCLDALVDVVDWPNLASDLRRCLMFAVLAHDFGKPTTTFQKEREGQLRWVSPGHAVAGCPLAESWLARIGAPSRFAPKVLPLVQHHMAHHGTGNQPPSDSHLRRLARKLAPSTIAELVTVMRADSRGRPPRQDPQVMELIDTIENRARELALEIQAPDPIVLGRHLLSRGFKPGPSFKPILDAAFEAQLEGTFSDEPGSLLWLDSHLMRNQN